MDTTFQYIYQQFIFWLHALFVMAAVSIGFFISPLVAFGLVILHRAHIYFFGECLLSKFQRKAGGLPEGMNFLQLASKKLFGKEISSSQSRIIDYSLAGSVVVLTLIK